MKDMLKTIAMNALADIVRDIDHIKETASKPDGETWRHKITGEEHARLCNLSRNARANGAVLEACETLRCMGFTVECNSWIESNQLIGLDREHIKVNGVDFTSLTELVETVDSFIDNL